MHQQPHDGAPTGRATGDRPAFGAPRLDLPRFQFRESPLTSPPAQPRQVAVQPASVPAPAPAPATYHASPTAMQQPVAVTYAPAPVAVTYAPAPAPLAARPVPVAARPPMRAPLRQPMSSTTRPAAVAWSPPPAEPTLLQRITPVHMGVMMVMVMMFMVMSSGPSAMKVSPVRLPALAVGGGTAGDPMLARAGTTAVDAAAATGAAKAAGDAGTDPVRTVTPAAARAAAARRARLARINRGWIIVGNARVRRTVRSGGIPSPAAAANLQVAGGGRVAAGSTDSVNLNGIPSAAAAEELGPETLPYRPTDGVTLPRMVGERDSHALDSHYGSDTLPMEEAVATPALTPGAAAEQAQHRVAINELTHGSASAPPVNGGLIVGY